MKRSTTLAAAVAAALAMSTGAYAQDLEGASANNLGPAVVGASQAAEGGLFGGMGATGMAAASMGLMALGFTATIGNFSSDSDPGPASPPPPPPPPTTHH